MKTVFLGLIFISLSVLLLTSDLNAPMPTTFDEAKQQVEAYTGQGETLAQSGVNTIIETLSGTLSIGQTFIDTIVAIPEFINRINPLDNPDGFGTVCTTYESQSALLKGVLQTQRLLYNLLNDPNIETMEAYWIHEQERVYGLVCS